MTEVTGATTRQITLIGDDYSYLLEQHLDAVARTIADQARAEDDLLAIRHLWHTRVEDTLTPTLALVFHAGAAGIRDQLRGKIQAGQGAEAVDEARTAEGAPPPRRDVGDQPGSATTIGSRQPGGTLAGLTAAATDEETCPRCCGDGALQEVDLDGRPTYTEDPCSRCHGEGVLTR